MSDNEHRYMLGYQNEQGEFDVFAKFRGGKDITQEKITSIIRNLFKNGTLIFDETGYHFIEKKEGTHG